MSTDFYANLCSKKVHPKKLKANQGFWPAGCLKHEQQQKKGLARQNSVPCQ
ncbi:MAG: hypothetical protein KJ889_08555 [Gammaproteobacteria bacterium]|nr:hypothetical protein [Gammaproteobacteria bacterium]MBU4499210.1 hypothetical protein [Gammaproteobacteria bacterium]